jgi:predicted DNA-binding transcriptional regulator AlpA
VTPRDRDPGRGDDLRRPDGLPYFLTVSEAASLVGLTKVALRQRIARGAFPGICRLGNRSLRIETEVLLAAMRANGGRASSPTDEEVA